MAGKALRRSPWAGLKITMAPEGQSQAELLLLLISAFVCPVSFPPTLNTSLLQWPGKPQPSPEPPEESNCQDQVLPRRESLLQSKKSGLGQQGRGPHHETTQPWKHNSLVALCSHLTRAHLRTQHPITHQPTFPLQKRTTVIIGNDSATEEHLHLKQL